jgi:hypothetical protein
MVAGFGSSTLYSHIWKAREYLIFTLGMGHGTAVPALVANPAPLDPAIEKQSSIREIIANKIK